MCTARALDRLIARSVDTVAIVIDKSDIVLQNSRGRTRTCDSVVNSHLLYQLSYAGSTPEATPTGRMNTPARIRVSTLAPRRLQ